VAHRAPPDDHHRPPGVLLSRRAVSRRRGLCAAPVAACSPSAEHPATSRHGAEHHRSPSPSGSRAPRFVKRKLRCDDSEGHGNQRRQRPRDQSLEQPSTAFGKDSEAVAGGPGSAHPLRGFARLVLRPSRRPREFLPESFAAACRAGGAKPAKGTFSARMPFSEAACALREGNYAPASRKDSSLALRPTPTSYLSIPSVKRVIRLAACQPQCTTNWRGRRVRSGQIQWLMLPWPLTSWASTTIKLLYAPPASSHRATRRSTIQHGVVPCVVGACAWRRPRRERGALGARTGCLCLVT